MLAVLDKYLNFMKLTAAVSLNTQLIPNSYLNKLKIQYSLLIYYIIIIQPGTRGIKSVEMIIKHLTKCEKLQAEASGLPGTSA